MATAPTSIEQVYLDVLGRAPDPGGLAYWQSQFGPTVDANELATFQAASAPELASPLSNVTSVSDLYTNILQRPADDAGAQYWQSQFGPTIDANELATFKQAAAPELSNLLSQPTQVTQPANVATQIDPNSDLSNLYNEYFERAPDQGGYDYWMSQFGPTIDASERQIFDLAAQPEKYGITDVTSLYKNYMGRTDEEIAADPEGLKYWTDLFGPTISGEEFATFRSVAGQTEPGNVPTYLKVEDMYKDVLGKEATASDKAYWEGLLGKTVSQNELNEFKQAAQDQYEANYFENYFPVTKTRGMAQETTGLNNVGGQVSLSNILANIQGQYSPEVYTRSGGSYGAGRFLPYNAMTTGANTQNQNPDASLFAPASFEQYSQSLIDKSLDQAVAETMGVSGGSSGDIEAGAPSAWSNMTEQERGAWVQANPGKYVAGKMAAVALLPGGQFLATQQDPYMGMSLVEYGVGKASNAAMGGLLEPGKGAPIEVAGSPARAMGLSLQEVAGLSSNARSFGTNTDKDYFGD